jgi:flavodoxin
MNNIDRRRLFQRWARLVVAAGSASMLVPGPSRAQSGAVGASRRLVAYCSRTGHTRQAALAIAAAVGADLFEIVPATPFPAAYQETVDLNVRQRAAGEFPGAARMIPGLDRYDTVFLGYPVWAVDLPRLLVPFLRGQDFVGKTLAPFCTSAMSGLAGTEQTLRELCPQARVLPGLALPGGGRGHNTLVTRIENDARRRAEQWGRSSLEPGARR